MHQAMVRMDGEKMSKSLGNLVFVSDLAEEYDTRAIRLGVISHHYRDEWEWNTEIMPAAQERVARWASNGSGSGALDEVRMALDDDLSTPGAIDAIDVAVSKGLGVADAAALLGVDLTRPVE
jgi:L-cysteine:1D-myo-inositol 2-amino-2-deoxy-alpha-D-glucopyranoside ligase